MKPLTIYAVTLTILMTLVTGCLCMDTGGPTASPSPSAVESKVVSVSSMADIDAALENGPVLVKFGSESCYWCVQMIPVLDEISILYPGITVLDVDVDAKREFIKPFYISSIPQVDIIVRKNPDGTYLYVDNDGKPSDGILKSRIIGYVNADALKKPLDAALALRNSS